MSIFRASYNCESAIMTMAVAPKHVGRWVLTEPAQPENDAWNTHFSCCVFPRATLRDFHRYGGDPVAVAARSCSFLILPATLLSRLCRFRGL
ncbi:hypothetical protein VNO77_16574 [Canavalia gladiata]|uniref:Uncharacterized protein n=1 Tax=Canavalia gladiata TaxID=3824 RepID=A0AAN9LHM7_CANGL